MRDFKSLKSNTDLIEHLINTGVLKSENIKNALEIIDRQNFVEEQNKKYAYEDYALGIGYDQTISQPYTVVFMLELLDIKEGDNVLDIGSGSGWTTALLSYLIGESGAVIGIERVPALVEIGNKNLQKYNNGNATIIENREGTIGVPGQKFTKILVSAAGEELPEELIEQLEIGGILVIPVKNSILKFTKVSETEIHKKEYEGFVFVPLIK